MCGILYFVALTFFCIKILAAPTEPNNETMDYISEMGKAHEEVIRGKPNIKTLNLAYNEISILPAYTFHNNSYKNLNKIELYQNKINMINLWAFRGLKQLETVNLANNNITTLDPYTFKHNPKLTKLDLSANNINFNRLEVFLMSSTLETLIVSHNKIEQIYELTFVGVPNLKNLILNSNDLFTMSPNSFKPLNKLQYLSLANTGVYRLSESMFNNLPRTVDLQETPLSKRFDPALKKVSNNAVKSLITIDKYIFSSDGTAYSR